MATLTLKNVPDAVMKRLKAQAARHRRSLNSEAIDVLAGAGQAASVDVDALIARARAVRILPATDRFLTPRRLNAWKRQGRM
jgi:plasmid stability protein